MIMIYLCTLLERITCSNFIFNHLTIFYHVNHLFIIKVFVWGGMFVLQNSFELFIPDNKDQVIKACKTEADGRVVEGNHTFYRISAPTAEEKEEWMNSIK